MGLLDLMRPKWRHSDADTRLRAVAELTDPATLARVAREDEDDRVREAAIARIDDTETLTRIALTGAISPVHLAALAKLTDQGILARIATAAMDIRVREAAVRQMTDQSFLTAVIASSNPRPIRLAAIEALTDQAQLAKLAESDPDASVRASAAARLTNGQKLAAIAANDADASVRLAAAGAAPDDSLLVKLATEDHDQATREAAVAELDRPDTLYRIVVHKMDVSTDLLGDQFVMRAGQDAALAKIADPTLLAKIATRVEDQRLARTAIDRLTDQALIRGVLKSDHWFARQAAAEKLDDPKAILDLISSEQDLDVLDAAVSRLGELGTAGLDPAAIDKAREALKSAASAETEEAGSPRIITGSMPSAEKVSAHFERVIAGRKAG